MPVEIDSPGKTRTCAAGRLLEVSAVRAHCDRALVNGAIRWSSTQEPPTCGRAGPAAPTYLLAAAASLYIPRPTRLNRLSLASVLATVFLKFRSLVT